MSATWSRSASRGSANSGRKSSRRNASLYRVRKCQHRHCEERSDEAIHLTWWPHGLLRGACHRAALCADPLARNDAKKEYPMKLTFSPASPFARKVRIAAIELGLIDKIEFVPTTVVPGQPND